MTEPEAEEAIYQQWKTGWEALHGPGPQVVPFCLEDEVYDVSQLGPLGAWARVSIEYSTRAQVTHGQPSKSEVRGNIFVQLFAPQNEGTGKLARLSADVRTALAKKSLGDLYTYDGRPVKMPTDGRWAMRLVVVPFRYTETT